MTLGLLLTAAATTATPAESYAGGDGSIAVIAAKTLPVDGLSMGELKRLYMGNAVQSGGKALVPITYPKQSSIRQKFDKIVTGMSMDEEGLYWIDRKIRGQSGPPKSVDSESVTLRLVTKVDGAIGFVTSGITEKTIKVLRVDGKLPGEPGYRIK